MPGTSRNSNRNNFEDYIQIYALVAITNYVRHHYSLAVLIGFNPTTYSVGEDVGSVTVAVSLLGGILARDVTVPLHTMNGTAIGKSPNK